LSLRTDGGVWLKKALVASGAVRFAGAFGRGIAILMYHSVADDPKEYKNTTGDIAHSTANFKGQIEYLVRNYRLVTLEDILLFLEGRQPMPHHAVAVTFDDGYADNFDVALPVLDSMGIRATFYVTVKYVETGQPPWFCRLRHAFATTRKVQWSPDSNGHFLLRDDTLRETAFLAACDRCAQLAGDAQEEAAGAVERELDVEPFAPKNRLMMTWDQVRELARRGHVIGSHTMTHPNMAYVNDDEAAFELAESKRKLDEELGAPVVHFAYPGPALLPIWSDQTLATSKQVGYRTAVTTTSGLVRRHDNPLCLRRLGARCENEEFVWCLENTFLGRSM